MTRKYEKSEGEGDSIRGRLVINRYQKYLTRRGSAGDAHFWGCLVRIRRKIYGVSYMTVKEYLERTDMRK